MSEHNVQLKINYAKNLSLADKKASDDFIVEWHLPRILVALAVLLVLSSWTWYALQHREEEPTGPKVTELTVPEFKRESESAVPSKLNSQPGSTPASKPNIVTETAPVVKKLPESSSKPVPVVSTPAGEKTEAMILDRHIPRAALVDQLEDGVPGKRLKSHIDITTPREFYYYTDIKNTSHKGFVHRWLKNGQQILKKPLVIKKHNSLAYTSRMFDSGDKGFWRVELLNKKGDVLSYTTFYIQ